MRFLRLVILFTILVGSLLAPQAALAVTQTVTVTGQVLAHPTDFQVAVVATPTTPLAQSSTATFSVTYGSHLLYGDQLIVEAQWTAGLNGSLPVDIFTYVDGSASPGYGGVLPVIDLVNQKIDWSIPNLPANTTNQTVTFQLVTNSAYAGGTAINLPVTVKVISRTVNSTTASVTSVYQYQGAAPSPTPTPGPTIVPTPTPSATAETTPTPTPLVTPLPSPIISTPPPPQISLQSLIDTQLTLDIQTQQAGAISVAYGTSPTALSQLQTDESLAREYVAVLTNLQPATDYYVQVTSTAADGSTATSSIYHFKTAQTAVQPVVLAQSLTFITANSATLYAGLSADPTQAPVPANLILPKQTVYGFRFQVSHSQSIKKVLVQIKNAQVLGASTNTVDIPTPNQLSTQLIETKNGIFEGNLITPTQPGQYDILAQIFDIDGNIVQNKLANLHVSLPLTIIDRSSDKPIERAQVQLSYYSPTTQIYLPFPPQLFVLKNPDYTDPNGQLKNLALPQGDYQVKVIALGYQQATMDFVLGPEANQGYPQITLAKEPFNLVTTAQYYGNSFQDAQAQTQSFLHSFTSSTRFFELTALIVVCFLVLLTFLSFSSRLRIPIAGLFSYLIHRTKILTLQRRSGDRIKGRIFDENSALGLAGVEIFLIDERKQKVVAHTQTNSAGDFTFVKDLVSSYSLEIMADGYEPITYKESEMQAIGLGGYLISIKKRITPRSVLESGMHLLERSMALLFETLLVLSLGFEVAFGYALGWWKAAPFLIFSLVNLSLWILHLSHLRRERG